MKFARIVLATLVISLSVFSVPIAAEAEQDRGDSVGNHGGHRGHGRARSVPELGLTGAAAAAAVVVGGSLVVFGVRRRNRDNDKN
jgi:hypothetical protein